MLCVTVASSLQRSAIHVRCNSAGSATHIPCRLNMSHGDHKSHKAVVDLVKEYNKLNRNNVAIMLDTKGPEVRSGDVTEPIDMKTGTSLLTSCCVAC